MILTKTYLSKSNTIIKDNHANTGLNPILELNYGNMLTRGIIYFDHTKIKKLIDDKTYPDIAKLKHVLKMTNTSSIVDKDINGMCHTSQYDGYKKRASSFDLIFFLVPYEWDNGKGFDYVMDLYNGSHKGLTTDGSSWYKYRNHFKWDEEGIYTTEHLSKEMDLFTSKDGNKSNVIFGYQHFDYGNENIEIDITCIVNKFLSGEITNYGFGIAFAPSFEQIHTELTNYVGFFTQHTNSFFEPYVETTYNETIEDDRSNFYLDRNNKLYFYSSINGNYVNLDELPKCEVNGIEYEVHQATKGVYYINIMLSSDEYDEDTMLYDTWSNILYKGKNIKNRELSFVTKTPDDYFMFGLPNEKEDNEFIPNIYGIDDNEQIKRGDIRKINIDCRIPYSTNTLRSVEGIEYRLYVNEGEKQYDVIPWMKSERGYNENYFFVNTNELIPHRYHVDIRVRQNMELIYHRNMLEFDIVNDVTNYYN